MDIVTPAHERYIREKDPAFNIDLLFQYSLGIIIDYNDLQLCVMDKKNSKCLLFERYELMSVSNNDQLVEQVKEIYDNHHLLQAGYWKSISVAFRNHKFTLLPKSLFSENTKEEYLKINTKIVEEDEVVLYNIQPNLDAVNVFAFPRKLHEFIKASYPTKEVSFSHETAPFIQGCLQNAREDRIVYLNAELDSLTVVVTNNSTLEYCNKFQFFTSEDLLYYVLYVMKELNLSQENTKVTIWGDFDFSTDQIDQLYKHIRNIKIGDRPQGVSFGYMFDELEEHNYYTAFNLTVFN